VLTLSMPIAGIYPQSMNRIGVTAQLLKQGVLEEWRFRAHLVLTASRKLYSKLQKESK
jgi:hypothetical protein